jgi:hypothetical protein
MLNLRSRSLAGLALLVAASSAAAFATPEPAEAVVAPRKPLRVYVLAGQSNMQGHAEIRTFDSMATDPKTAPLLAEMRTRNGKPRVCERVWISSIGCLGDAYSDLQEATGKLTAGFGAPEQKIGPEFTFALTLEKHLDDGPILIIKTAWGGRSLITDFRPPSAGPRVFSDSIRQRWKERGLDPDAEAARQERELNGVFYRHMIEHVKRVLDDPKRVVPGYDPKAGYALSGFVWFQGFNDFVDDWSYPNQGSPGGYDEYADLLEHLIRDVRKDLSAPNLPFVIGVMGIGGDAEGAKAPQQHFREAQRKPATRDEFRGNVHVVETSPFWDADLDALAQRMERLNDAIDRKFENDPKRSEHAKQKAREQAIAKEFEPAELKRLEAGVSNGGYHYLGAAKILAPIGKAFAEALLFPKRRPPRATEMAGYLLVPHEKAPETFNAGFSMYVAAWPLLKHYPGQDFQSGLFGTWMFAQRDGQERPHTYSDIEGGLGWWRDTRFATETPKFIMGGVALEFSEWANGPGAGKGRDWNEPAGHYAIAQLSPWVLWPPDGLNLKQGTAGELFGYGYLPLPLTEPKTTTAGKDVPTGDHSWTLFLNTGNFKGPVAFFVPYFWSKPTIERPDLAGIFLDSRPSDPNRAVQMETQHVPAYTAVDANGVAYARIAPTQFPAAQNGDAPLIHRMLVYSKAALWDRVREWFKGGAAVSGTIDVDASAQHEFEGGGDATWEIDPGLTSDARRVPLAWRNYATPIALDAATYAYRWSQAIVAKSKTLVTLPEYYRLDKGKNGEDRWVAVAAKDVPADVGLADVEFPSRGGKLRGEREPYVTPDDPQSAWKKPGPVAGPFEVELGDGSVLTYAWYRFADQPALQHADLTAAEREEMQRRVELIHRSWTKDKEYLPPIAVGSLADLDPALLVKPPKGLEAGYVPIVTRQAAK